MSYYMTEAEREHNEHEMFARQDYLSEAFGAEARTLDAQAQDDWEYDQMLAAEEEADERGITVGALLDERRRKIANRIEADKCAACLSVIRAFLDPCPF